MAAAATATLANKMSMQSGSNNDTSLLSLLRTVEIVQDNAKSHYTAARSEQHGGNVALLAAQNNKPFNAAATTTPNKKKKSKFWVGPRQGSDWKQVCWTPPVSSPAPQRRGGSEGSISLVSSNSGRRRPKSYQRATSWSPTPLEQREPLRRARWGEGSATTTGIAPVVVAAQPQDAAQKQNDGRIVRNSHKTGSWTSLTNVFQQSKSKCSNSNTTKAEKKELPFSSTRHESLQDMFLPKPPKRSNSFSSIDQREEEDEEEESLDALANKWISSTTKGKTATTTANRRAQFQSRSNSVPNLGRKAQDPQGQPPPPPTEEGIASSLHSNKSEETISLGDVWIHSDVSSSYDDDEDDDEDNEGDDSHRLLQEAILEMESALHSFSSSSNTTKTSRSQKSVLASSSLLQGFNDSRRHHHHHHHEDDNTNDDESSIHLSGHSFASSGIFADDDEDDDEDPSFGAA